MGEVSVKIGDVYTLGGMDIVVVDTESGRARCAQPFSGRHTWIQMRRLEREYDKAGEIRATRAKRVLATTLQAKAEEKKRAGKAAARFKKGGEE